MISEVLQYPVTTQVRKLNWGHIFFAGINSFNTLEHISERPLIGMAFAGATVVSLMNCIDKVEVSVPAPGPAYQRYELPYDSFYSAEHWHQQQPEIPASPSADHTPPTGWAAPM